MLLIEHYQHLLPDFGRIEMELKDAILKRRSVRKFTDYEVTNGEVNELLDAARWAPSWANTQVWEFIVVRDKDIIQKIVSTYTETNPATKCSLAASVLIVGCAKTGISGSKKGTKESSFSEWFMFDLGLAVQNLCLRAHDLGLGTVIVGSLDHASCKQYLSVPDGTEVVVVIPVGKPAVPDKQGPPRKNISDFTHMNIFGNAYKETS
jgi:nitroreductase